MMKGLELSQLYYDEIIRPFLETRAQELTGRIAVGLVGEGSECFGYDDELSRDHDWGARVCLWLNQTDYQNFGNALAQQLKELPTIFRGYPVCWSPGRSGVLEISTFFKKYLRKGTAPETVGEWLSIPEHYLATASNGGVFADPAGEFLAIWNDLRQGYPEDIRLKKLAARCMVIGQAGQYNYPRLVRRDDLVAAQLALNEFIHAVISAAYLLNNRYTPFYKWMNRDLKELPVLGAEISSRLEHLIRTEDKQDEIEDICGLLIREFHQQGISDQSETYMVEQGNRIHEHIRLEALRNTDPWMGELV